MIENDPELAALKQQVNGEAPKRRGRPPKSKSETEVSASQEPQTPPAQPKRVEQVQRERRRRRSEDLDGTRMNLHVPREIREQADRQGLELRWITAGSLRVEQLTKYDDWDPMKDPTSGQQITKAAGNTDDGQMLLVGKPKEFCEADRKAKNKRLSEELKEAEAGRDDRGGLVNYHRGNIELDDGRLG